jgi:hypothetical protein
MILQRLYHKKLAQASYLIGCAATRSTGRHSLPEGKPFSYWGKPPQGSGTYQHLQLERRIPGLADGWCFG